MKRKCKWIATLAGVGLAGCIYVLPAQAQVNPGLQRPPETVAQQTQTQRTNQQQRPQNNNFMEGANQLLNQFLGALKAPDLQGIFNSVLGSVLGGDGGDGANLQDGGWSTLFEGRTPTFDMGSDQAEAQVREASITHAQDTALGQQAQDTLKQELEVAQGLTDQNRQLGEESQTLDVSQQILQNISQQLSLASGVQQSIYAEQQKDGVNQSISHVLQAQAAKELSEQGTRNRRETTGTANAAARQAYLGIMPGGAVLGETRQR